MTGTTGCGPGTASDAALTGYAAPIRAMRARWGRRLPNGRLEEAELDVAAVDHNAGRHIFVDRAVTCAHSTYAPRR